MATSKGRRGAETRGSGATDGVNRRRAKNEPVQYQKPRSMDSEFADDDLDADALYEYAIDEGDGDIEWDDSIPPRGGGKSADR
jgi:hypothetical protein